MKTYEQLALEGIADFLAQLNADPYSTYALSRLEFWVGVLKREQQAHVATLDPNETEY